jgi:hypothetical protein
MACPDEKLLPTRRHSPGLRIHALERIGQKIGIAKATPLLDALERALRNVGQCRHLAKRQTSLAPPCAHPGCEMKRDRALDIVLVVVHA